MPKLAEDESLSLAPHGAHSTPITDTKMSAHAPAQLMRLMEEAIKGLTDVAAGNVKDARSAISAIKHRRSS